MTVRQKVDIETFGVGEYQVQFIIALTRLECVDAKVKELINSSTIE